MSRSRIGFSYRLAAVIVRPVLTVVAKREWRGMENMPENGGYITVVNHNSELDPLSYAHFQYNTGQPPRFLAKDSLFGIPVLGAFLRATGQIPVLRHTTDAAQAFGAAVDAVKEGKCVAIYPEGTLTRDPSLWPMTGKSGAARVALETGAPVIPVAQWGAHRVFPPYAKGRKRGGEPRLRLFPRATFQVVAGPPVDLSEFQGEPLTTDVLRRATDKIMDAITALLEELRGETAPAVRYDMRKALAEQSRQKREARKAEKAREIEKAREAEGGTAR